LAFKDKGYIGKKISEELIEVGLKLITRKHNNMKSTEPIGAFTNKKFII
jgi:hypothetical protein